MEFQVECTLRTIHHNMSSIISKTQQPKKKKITETKRNTLIQKVSQNWTESGKTQKLFQFCAEQVIEVHRNEKKVVVIEQEILNTTS